MKARLTNIKYSNGKVLLELIRKQNKLNYKYQYPIRPEQLKINSDGTGELVIPLDEVTECR